MTGKVGRDVTVDSAYASARRTGLCLLSTLKAELGDLPQSSARGQSLSAW
jgi:hypothetical protein